MENNKNRFCLVSYTIEFRFHEAQLKKCRQTKNKNNIC